MQKYHQLTCHQRYQIQALISLKKCDSNIARSIGVHRSTVGREIKRNSLAVWREAMPLYESVAAHGTAVARRAEGCEARWIITGKLKNLIHKRLKMLWSPEQISGSLRKKKSKLRAATATIYRHIERDGNPYGENLELYKLLRRFKPTRRKRRKKTRKPPGYSYPRLSHRERPEAAGRRSRHGDFERDLMEGLRGKAAALVFADRKSRKVFIEKVKKRNSKDVQRASIKIIKNRIKNPKLSRTITNDNGYEFIYSKIPQAQKKLGVPVYFTDPSSPWQRGTVENCIGLIRQYFPKKTDLTNVTNKEIRLVEAALNNRPRKVLDFMTPNEVYKIELQKLSQSSKP